MNSWIENAVFYQIYPLGFCGAPRYHQENITHSINKIIEWIPHLKKLHINALYLGPVFESSEHGYDTSDYRVVDHRLGDHQDLKQVCDALHDAGIRIIFDGVFNHVGRSFWAFQDVKEKREASRYASWFQGLRFDCDNPFHDGFCYDTWRGYHNLIKLNLKNEEVIAYLLDSIAMWIHDFHIDGLRLDAADCMDRDFFRRLKQFCRQQKEDFWLMGEIIHGNYNVWANEEMLDSVTNYECYKGLYSSHNDHNYFEIGHSLNRQFQQGGIYEHLKLYNFVDNHDVNRLASTVKNEEDLFNIYTMLYTMPGIPSLYYGSEWALKGTHHDGSDADIRPCLHLSKQKDTKLTEHLMKLGEIRQQHTIFYQGSYETILLKNEQFVFARRSDDEILYIAFNVNDKDQEIELENVTCPSLYDLLHHEAIPVQNQKACFVIPAKKARILIASEAVLTPKTNSAIIEKNSVTTSDDQEHTEEELPMGRYEHYKGKHYTVLYIATHSETLEKYVVYRQLYGDESVWIRPLSMFTESVEVDGEMVKRFRYIEK